MANGLKQLFKTILLAGMVFMVVTACRASTAMYVTVVKVHDGDTVTLENGQTIRYLGIDTPEMGYEDKKPEPFGLEAARFNRKLTLGNRSAWSRQSNRQIDLTADWPMFLQKMISLWGKRFCWKDWQTVFYLSPTHMKSGS